MTKIEWVKGDDGSDGMSWNALRAVRLVGEKFRSANHCEHVNEACRWCYAERTNSRLGGLPFKPGHRGDYRFVVDEKKLLEPLRRRKPTRIFVESMSDAFGAWWTNEQIDQLYAVMALTPQHTYVNLSKRPERRRDYLNEETKERVQLRAIEIATDTAAHSVSMKWPLPNVIEGTSVSCQPEADEFVPVLLATKAARFVLSVEPMLGPLVLHPTWLTCQFCRGRGYHLPTFSANHFVPCEDCVRWARAAGLTILPGQQATPGPRLNGVFCGGESGPQARPMHPQWPRDLRDQCAATGTPVHFKQWGEWVEMSERGSLPGRPTKSIIVRPNGATSEEGEVADYPGSVLMFRVGKKAAGRLLDGVEHNGFPS